MRLVLATVAALMAVSGARAADECRRYVHETEANTWIFDFDKEVVWHKPDGEYRYFKEYTAPNSTFSVAASRMEAGSIEVDEVPYRFATIDGKKTLIWDTWYYFNSCPETKS